MNIFVLDESPIRSAQWQHDRHVVKMILESCQLLSCAIQVDSPLKDSWIDNALPWGDQLYKITHENHPCNLWTRETPANFVWLTIHLSELLNEYSRRFPGKKHTCESMRWQFAAFCGKLIGSGFFTKGPTGLEVSFAAQTVANRHSPFVYCGPLDYAGFDGPIHSYRAYYLAHKIEGNRWSNHPLLSLPDWLAPHATIFNRPTVKPTRKRLFTPINDKPEDCSNPARVTMPRRFGSSN